MLSSTPTILPANFYPNDQHVIIGRGRITKMHSGNQRFDQMVAVVGPEYSAAPNKAEKGLILTRLVNAVHDQATDAGFVRRDPVTGVWTLVEEALARQTAAQALRNALHHSYRSSKQFKSKRRIQQIAKEKQQSTSPIATATFSLSQQQEVLRCVSPSDSVPEETAAPLKEATNTFSFLMAKFAASVDPNDDPFEPRPIAPENNFLNSIAPENNFLNFEPIPFAAL